MLRVYTIGHSTHSLERLMQILQMHSVVLICDVRSAPYSKYAPQFNREPLERSLQAAGFRYIYLGQQLGGRSSNPEHYSDGQVQYAAIAASATFREGLERLAEDMARAPVALMCVEKDPANCHRTLLVTRQLRAKDVEILHILSDGRIETNQEFEKRLRTLWKLPTSDMFGDDESLVLRAYDLQSKKVAYSRSAEIQPKRGPEE